VSHPPLWLCRGTKPTGGQCREPLGRVKGPVVRPFGEAIVADGKVAIRCPECGHCQAWEPEGAVAPRRP
jgi:hypothetical protein